MEKKLIRVFGKIIETTYSDKFQLRTFAAIFQFLSVVVACVAIFKDFPILLLGSLFCEIMVSVCINELR